MKNLDDWLDVEIYENVFDAIQGNDYDLVSCEHFVDTAVFCQKIKSTIVYPCIMRSHKILITNLCGYHYLQRDGFVMHSFTVASFEKMSRFQTYMHEELLRLEEDLPQVDAIIVTATYDFADIKNRLKKRGYMKVISLEEVLTEI